MITTSPTVYRRGTKPASPKQCAGADSAKTKKPAADLRRYPDRWTKAPVRGYCPETGLTRAAFYQLATAGKVKSSCIKKPGAVRGNRLFHLGSILAFLDATARVAFRQTRVANL